MRDLRTNRHLALAVAAGIMGSMAAGCDRMPDLKRPTGGELTEILLGVDQGPDELYGLAGDRSFCLLFKNRANRPLTACNIGLNEKYRSSLGNLTKSKPTSWTVSCDTTEGDAIRQESCVYIIASHDVSNHAPFKMSQKEGINKVELSCTEGKAIWELTSPVKKN